MYKRQGENSEPYTVILSPLRITPAGAGKTVQTSLFRPARRGSPPQVRGKPVCNSERNVNAGITPAGAGKTLHGGASSMRTRDHPRRCGENFRPPLQAPSCIGSPPQVRGKRPMNFLLLLQMRITPAGAGKTYVEEIVDLDSEDHPRRCGENR